MATSTDVPIYTTTLASAAANVVIPLTDYQMYTNLKLVIEGSHDQAGSSTNNWRVQFNGNTTGNLYSDTVFYGSGSTASSARDASINFMYLGMIGQASTSPMPLSTFLIMDYSSSAKHKLVLAKGGASPDNINVAAGLWRDTTPVTSITLFMTGQNVKAGTTVSVYGIGTASLAAKATGGAIYSDKDYWYHVFTNTASFVPTQSLTAQVLTIAGGGGGGGFNGGGGGGAGGHVLSSAQSFANGTSYTCTVGAGGTGGTTVGGQGTDGASSTVTGGALSLTASVGGGGGGASDIGSPVYHGRAGGSGGGAGNQSYGVGGSATSGQGYAGGNGGTADLPGGGGGAGGVGSVGSSSANKSVAGGPGTTIYSAWLQATGAGQIANGDYYIAGGGSSGCDARTGTLITTRSPGGGGINSTNANTAAGLINTGSGGTGASYNGGSTNWVAGKGGSGIVVIRYAK